MVSMYGRTDGSGDTGYTRLEYAFTPRALESMDWSPGVQPDGADAFGFLRQDGRIAFYDPSIMTASEPGNQRLNFSDADSRHENFIRVADVLDSNAGEEIIVGFHDSDAGVRGYRLLSMPETWDGDQNDNGGWNPVTLDVLGTYDLGYEVRNISVVSVPEPASLGLMAIGGGLLLSSRRRRA
jgi:hypothetical protein